MEDVIYQELLSQDGRIQVGILIYIGSGDPVRYLNEAVHLYVRNEGFNEFIDANMDNPWIRVIIKGINDMAQVRFNPKIHHL
jgi:hypothetical protein